MTTVGQLKKQYKNTIKSSTDFEVHIQAYIDFLIALYKLNGNTIIFKYAQKDSVKNAKDILRDYILSKIEPPEFYLRSLDEVITKYLNNLIDYEIIEEGQIDEISDLFEVVIFEALKGIDTLGKTDTWLYYDMWEDLTLEEQSKVEEQARVAYICWFNMIEKLNAALKLAAVENIVNYYINTIKPPGQQVLEQNDFSEFWLKEGELEYYRELCDVD